MTNHHPSMTPPQENVPYVPGSPEQPFTLQQLAQPAQIKKSKAPLIVGIIAGSVLLLCGGLVTIGLLTADPTASPQAITTTGGIPPQTAGVVPPAPTTQTVDVLEATFGQTLILDTPTGDEVHFTVFADKTYARSAYGRPEKGIFYGIRAEVKVVKGSAYACFCDFALIAPDGTAYEGTTVGFKNEFNTVQLNAGQRTGGIIVFDVPATAIPGGRIELREGSLFSGGDQGFWKIP